MRRLISLAALVLCFVSIRAADEKPKPNTLTPKEVSDGWLLLFDGETTFGWQIDGEVSVKDGVMVLGGDKETTARLTTVYGECKLSLDWELQKGGAALYWSDTARHVDLAELSGKKPGWGHLSLELYKQRIAYKYQSPGGAGGVGLRIENGDTNLSFKVPVGGKLLLRDVKLQPFGLKALFNGKDLAGWKEHPGKKSKFTVEEGAIHIKDGPGDLQTEGQWADFVLQLECISNGKHLNSGVFFRCRPNEYQQGYEAQVHNGFGEQPKEYAIEEYDPKTNQLTGTRKEKFLALDYGTGAIYRRMPARKQMAKDGEWFGMTVVAQGRHLAVWVNGVQVTDWTDNRPIADNARKGAMLEQGNISLQGHDPTTDLSFRNFRIAELRSAKKE